MAKQISYEDAVALDFTGKSVLIIGWPTSGKTHFANLLEKKYPDHKIIHTDDFIDPFSFENGMYLALEDIVGTEKAGIKTISEGVAGYRILRKGAETGVYRPDIVVELRMNFELMIENYRRSRPGKKIEGVVKLVAGCTTVLSKYFSIVKGDVPEWYEVSPPVKSPL